MSAFEYDIETGETVERDLTDEERADRAERAIAWEKENARQEGLISLREEVPALMAAVRAGGDPSELVFALATLMGFEEG